MTQIQLANGTWEFNTAEALGPVGSFGAVFAGAGSDGTAVAVKRIFSAAGPHAGRELQLAEYLLGQKIPHVIPILDAGFDSASGHYYIVMARADMSLQEMIGRSAPLGEPEALEIASAIVAGLAEIGNIVHRDLKPGNVLLHHGVWKLADLGLARFVEDATSLNTMKDFLSAPYAAPEQWRGERATKAVDVYAVGCILHALTSGQPPFPGPERADYARQHLNDVPPALSGSVVLNRIATSCLAKSPLVRPSLDSLRAQLRRAANPGKQKGIPKRLLEAALVVDQTRAEEEAARNRRATEAEERRAAARSALEALDGIMQNFVQNMESAANAKVERETELRIRLGDAALVYRPEFPLLEPDFYAFRRAKDWDLLAGAFIGVQQLYGWVSDGKTTRSANLWFGRLTPNSDYRWWEVGFYYSPSTPEQNRKDSFGHPQPEPWGATATWDYQFRSESLGAFGWGYFRLAYNPRPIDGDAFDEFCERWADWLALAALNQLPDAKDFPEEPLLPHFQLGL